MKKLMVLMVLMVSAACLSGFASASKSVTFDLDKSANEQVLDFLHGQVESEYGGGSVAVWVKAEVTMRCSLPTDTTDVSKAEVTCVITPKESAE